MLNPHSSQPHRKVSTLTASTDRNRNDVSGGDTLVPMERMSAGKLQLKQVLLANKIELEITMFENETASIVSTITVNRGRTGGPLYQ